MEGPRAGRRKPPGRSFPGATLAEKDLLISTQPAKFFTEPHYNGFPAVLVRLEAVPLKDLKVLITEAWRCQAPKELRGTVA